MNSAMKLLAAALLEEASSLFSNRGCNDFDVSVVPGFESNEDRAALDLHIGEFLRDPGRVPNTGVVFEDWILMSVVAKELRREAIAEQSFEKRDAPSPMRR